MIKWLTGAPRRSRDWVTDDPLATVTPRPFQVYAVSRVNPIFIEEDVRKSGLCERSGAGKSGSSGYESQRSSSGWSGEEDTLEHPLGQAKSTPLSTIPEGQVDYCIPRPIWPRYEDRQRKPPTVRVDRGTLRKMRRPERRVQVHPGEEKLDRSPYDLLRELSLAINMAVDRSSNELPAEEILRDIGQKINKSLDALTAQNSYQGRTFEEKTKTNRISSERLSSEHALRRLSVNLSRSEQVAAVGRALSLSGSSGSDSDLEAGRLSLLRKLGRFPAPEPLYNHSQGSTSSTSSGFSDLTPTPPSSASASSRPVFLHENPVSVPTRVRNAMIYETLQCRVPGGYEKLRLDRRIELDRQWTICEKEATHAITEKNEKCVFPSLHWPDFTLDGQQAELLTRRLQASKRQRCWCRLLTTAVGFFFFLFSVVVVSMVCTRGKRMFGSL